MWSCVLWGSVEPSLEVPPLGTAKHRPQLLRNKVDMLFFEQFSVWFVFNGNIARASWGEELGVLLCPGASRNVAL